ncbi:TPA: RidA family protein [Pseudomonas putida]|uniref:RidA family protein n=1 Tax=Pseudomonas TaxID=286 RepID=UPI00110CE584|nr:MULTISPECIES: RidA family protein [Pseudomonas]MCS4061395.1 enamine deaminase RidA (YjgF/YER057c/UK114 family) [Pseudomonas putida]MDD1993638.1 RidA family protein [Pseudomonas putida]HDS0916456.1 RidA family protein [Pseudomonas putida]HDS0932091.1 RidA family protein [Pseudomonas putida]HDS1781498.1 RidA family protein [Pseudomonas putida]
MSKVLEKLAAMGLELPAFNTRGGNYVLYTRFGNLIYTAGQVSLKDDVLQYKGTVGVDLDLETAQAASRVCALNLLSIANHASEGKLDRLRVLKVNGFVKCLPSFEQQAKVVDGASDLFVELFGAERGAHARAAVGVAALPRGAPVEIEAVFAIE